METYLVTGAAGFIGSNLVEALIKKGDKVRGIDNFITGKRENIEPFLKDMDFEEGDIRDLDLCKRMCKGVDFVFHEAAIGSVPRSVEDPITTNDHNVNGTINMLVAARDAKVKRFVYAASSSAYGNTEVLPKVEMMGARPLSPYAVTKYVGELYCSVFYKTYGLQTVGLRYFNVFGPRQDPEGAYAAVIPKFIRAILRGERPVIYGDGEQTRDFCYIDNVVQANLKACLAGDEALGEIFNCGAGGRISLNELTKHLLDFMKSDLLPEYQAPRAGDIRDSQASIEKARNLLGYQSEVDVVKGLEMCIEWYRENLS